MTQEEITKREEKRIDTPEGKAIEHIEIIDSTVVIKYIEKKLELPKSWEEFCEMYPVKADKDFFIGLYSDITAMCEDCGRDSISDKDLLPNRATAEAILALCQLIQLRDCYNGDWAPDWTDDEVKKYVIELIKDTFVPASYCNSTTLLYFKTEELRDEFLRNFLPLIEKLKPLYGIKKGGCNE